MYYHTRKTTVLLWLVFIFVVSIHAQSTKTNANAGNQCTVHRTCAECIQTPKCVWCSEKRTTTGRNGPAKARCVHESFTKTKGGSSWCSNEMKVNVASEVRNVEEKPFSSNKDDLVQITPQRVKMILRSGEEQTLRIKYKQANNSVDLYFLMDLSASMEHHKNNLAQLGLTLRETMMNLTKDFRLGFGSFVDKVILPMTSTESDWLTKHCRLAEPGKVCAPAYGYKHQMKLTDKTSLFEENVQKAPISGNLDAAEGGLDAMMQAMVCGDKIGWRKNARHILVYSSDATYHIAGDGRLAGLIDPNDEKCHLDDSGFYTHAELLDYPSITQINQQALANNMHIIFAIANTPAILPHYQALQSRINGSGLGILDDKSDSVVKIIYEEYKKLIDTLIMGDNATAPLEVRYFTRCLNTADTPPQERKECSGVHENTVFEFDVTVKAVRCPERTDVWRQTFEIKPERVSEGVMVDVELICDCPCSNPNHETYDSNSTMCSGSGDLTCGVCACKDGFLGDKCNCAETLQGPQSDVSCRDENDKVCSGHGNCVCGICICEERANTKEKFSGQFCECDNFSCEQSDGQICGGPSRGRCECGKCVCEPGFGGLACNCRSSKSTCIPPGENTTICNGFGDCVCGSCNCTTEGRTGDLCQVCPTCPTQRCDELKNCVECLAYKAGPEYEEGEGCPKCLSIELDTVDNIDESPNRIHGTDIHLCTMPDSSGCTFVFTYESGGRGDTEIASVVAEKAKRCPDAVVNAYGVAGGAILATLFLGLVILLIWKLLTTYHDRREWLKFEKERVAANWGRGDNPLFKEPTTSFNNPTFDGVKG